MLSAFLMVVTCAADAPVRPANSDLDAHGVVVQPASTPMPVIRVGSGRVTEVRERKLREDLDRRGLGPDGRVAEILGLPRALIPLETGVADRGPLSTNLKVVKSEAAAYPIGWEHLYLAPDDSGQLVRGNGGLYMTFPYSTFKKTKKGLKITLPPGATFHIGMPRAWQAVPPTPPTQEEARPGQESARLRSEIGGAMGGRVERRIDRYRGDGEAYVARAHNASASGWSLPALEQTTDPTATEAPQQSLPRISTDEAYRRAFLAALRVRRAE